MLVNPVQKLACHFPLKTKEIQILVSHSAAKQSKSIFKF